MRRALLSLTPLTLLGLVACDGGEDPTDAGPTGTDAGPTAPSPITAPATAPLKNPRAMSVRPCLLPAHPNGFFVPLSLPTVPSQAPPTP